MKADIQKLVAERGVDAIVVEGGKECGPLMLYITGGVRLLSAIYIEKKNGEKLLVHSLIEREEAAKSGLPCLSYSDLGLKGLLDEEKSTVRAYGRLYEKLFDRLSIKGKIIFFGQAELSRFLPILEEIKKRVKGIEIDFDKEESLFDVARRTKSEDEVEKIRRAGEKTADSLKALVQHLRSLKQRGGKILKADGTPLRIGDMRTILRIEFTKRGLLEGGGSIVSQGKDSAVPHNVGRDEDEVIPGKTIIVDIFPRDTASGYCFDMTRTLVFGKSSDEVKRIYGDVLDTFFYAAKIMDVGKETRVCQEEVCAFFEKKGYPTIRQNESAVEGYVHSIGHGIGLEVHESPAFGATAANKDRVSPGMVFTVEPGLYFPSKEIGVRIEDVFYVESDGKLRNLSEFPYEFEIPVAES
ncbi:MAG: M24 family metallopeptidase [Candidatus Eisenbacteria bacterium]|nr:M24 family metallopeptidase [Candidatus Eisenbacteria bacterium]